VFAVPNGSIPLVAIVDDHPIFVDGLEVLFSKTRMCKVIAKGTCADDAVAIAAKKAPDLIILDIDVPGDALAAIMNICHRNPLAKILVCTASTSVDSAVRALNGGANAYFLKGGRSDDLLEAIQCVANGANYITPSFAPTVIAALQAGLNRENARFTAREAQVAQLLSKGLTNREIAVRMKIGEKTVKHYMTLLMQKLDVRNRLEAVISLQKLELR